MGLGMTPNLKDCRILSDLAEIRLKELKATAHPGALALRKSCVRKSRCGHLNVATFTLALEAVKSIEHFDIVAGVLERYWYEMSTLQRSILRGYVKAVPAKFASQERVDGMLERTFLNRCERRPSNRWAQAEVAAHYALAKSGLSRKAILGRLGDGTSRSANILSYLQRTGFIHTALGGVVPRRTPVPCEFSPTVCWDWELFQERMRAITKARLHKYKRGPKVPTLLQGTRRREVVVTA